MALKRRARPSSARDPVDVIEIACFQCGGLFHVLVFKDRFLAIVEELSAEAQERFGFERYPDGAGGRRGAEVGHEQGRAGRVDVPGRF